MRTKTADENERASEIEEAQRQEGVQRVLAAAKPPMDWVSPECYDCDQEIPAARLATGAFRCIHCQQTHEFNMRHHRSRFE